MRVLLPLIFLVMIFALNMMIADPEKLDFNTLFKHLFIPRYLYKASYCCFFFPFFFLFHVRTTQKQRFKNTRRHSDGSKANL